MVKRLVFFMKTVYNVFAIGKMLGLGDSYQ